MTTFRLTSLLPAIVAGAIIAWPAASAQNPASTGAPPASIAYRYRFLGVYDEMSGDPIEGVEVSDFVGGNKSLTTSTGTVSLLFLPEGTTLVRLRKLGYEGQTLTVTISPADTTPLTIVLRRATQLPAVVVTDSALVGITPHMRDFAEHVKDGLGGFITEKELRDADNRNLSTELSSHFSGMQAMQAPGGKTFLVSSRKRCSGLAMRICKVPDCYIRVFVDGMLFFNYTTGAEIPDFSRMRVSDYQGVEFYPSTSALPKGIPPTDSDCGTLLLWTRDR